MSESRQHCNLADKIVEWAKIKCGFSLGPFIFIHRANDVSGKVEVPQQINGSIPDVFIKNTDKYEQVIGEAKTPKDLERPHTKEQLVNYLAYCNETPSAVFVLAVPWPYIARARNLINLTASKHGFTSAKSVVVDDLGECFVL
ncbi:MAG: hypothetical protein C4575_07345 [Desulforudis sp.]|jgi:hypothetical protein|nr:MAG: hypothetical protein C4575_07345 [Desulforudis sp.]